MEITLKIGSLLGLLAITYQDFKERKVSVYLFILALIFVSFLYYRHTNPHAFLINIVINLTTVVLMLGILVGYSWFKLKQPLFEVFGLGDALFFLVLAFGFSTTTFIVLFVSSLVFALLIFIAIKSKLNNKTVPLAGLQALFLVLVFGVNWMFDLLNMYQ